MRLWFDMVTKKDARLLIEWWNANTSALYFVRRSTENPRFWSVWRQDPATHFPLR